MWGICLNLTGYELLILILTSLLKYLKYHKETARVLERVNIFRVKL